MNTRRMILKLSALSLAGAMMMGNTDCSGTTPAPAPRSLKNLVEATKIYAQPVQVTDNQVFDLQFVVNQQFPTVLASSGQFAVLNHAALGSASNSAEASSMSVKDSAILSKVAGDVSAQAWTGSKEAKCLINLPQYKLGGAINSYEWVAGGGLTIGYTPAGSHAVSNIGGTVTFDMANMNMSLNAYHSINNQMIESTTVDQSQLKTKVKFDISFGAISVGPEFYYQKGLAATTQEALNLALTSLRTLTEKWGWQSRTGLPGDNFITIVGGNDVGMKQGDQIAFYNTTYQWDDNRICDPNAYHGALDGPMIAKGVVSDVGDFISSVKVDQDTMIEDPLPGAVVKVIQLVADPVAKK